MPHYLLRMVSGSPPEHVATTPFLATDDRAAVRDGLACVAGLRAAGVLDAESFTIDTLEIGFFCAATGEMGTRSDIRLYDSADPDVSLDPAPRDWPQRLRADRTLRQAVAAFNGNGDDFEEFEEREIDRIGARAESRFSRREEP